MMRYFDPRFEAYAQFGAAGSPMQTVRVDVRLRPTSFGNHHVKLNGHWLRLRSDDNSNGYAIYKGERVPINLIRNEV